MSNLIAILIYAALYAVYALVLALTVRNAVEHYKSNLYFRFGVEVAVAVTIIFGMARLWFR